MFENLGLIQSQGLAQSFTQDASISSTFSATVDALSGGPFNFSMAHRLETASTIGIPLDGYSYGAAGPSSNLSGYWYGSEIDYITVTVDPFSFRTHDFGPNGGSVYQLFNPQGPGVHGIDTVVGIRYDFYGTQGAYQEPQGPGVPEPFTWILWTVGFGCLGGAVRRNRLAW